MPESNSSGDTFDQWAIVDVMGHQRYIGRVTEQVIAGQGFVRIDVPETEKQKPWTKLIGTGSIYAITPVTEDIGRAMASKRTSAPVDAYDLPRDFQPRITSDAAMDEADEYEDEDCRSVGPF